jgi:hypothetical protein
VTVTPDAAGPYTVGQVAHATIACTPPSGLTITRCGDVSGDGTVTIDTSSAGTAHVKAVVEDDLGQVRTVREDYTVVAAPTTTTTPPAATHKPTRTPAATPAAPATTTAAPTTPAPAPTLGPVKHVGTSSGAGGGEIRAYTVPRAGRFVVRATLTIGSTVKSYRHTLRVFPTRHVSIGRRIDAWAHRLTKRAGTAGHVTVTLTYTTGSITRQVNRRTTAIGA